MKQEIEYYEKQYLPLWLRIGITGFTIAIFLFIFYTENYVVENSLFNFLFPIIIIVLVTAFIWVINLQTVINSEGIYVKMFPMFRYKVYEWENIQVAEVVKSNFYYKSNSGLKLYLFTSKGFVTSYSVSSNYCIKLTLNNNRKIRIDTAQPDEIEEILKKLEKIL